MSFMLQITLLPVTVQKAVYVYQGFLKRALCLCSEFQFMTENISSQNNLFRTKPSMSYSRPGYLVELCCVFVCGCGHECVDPIVLCLSPMVNLFHCLW